MPLGDLFSMFVWNWTNSPVLRLIPCIVQRHHGLQRAQSGVQDVSQASYEGKTPNTSLLVSVVLRFEASVTEQCQAVRTASKSSKSVLDTRTSLRLCGKIRTRLFQKEPDANGQHDREQWQAKVRKTIDGILRS